MKNDILRIGTRGSKLALWQAHYIEKKIKEFFPNISTKICSIKTEGDIVQESLSKIGGKGIFVKEIELALINAKIDIAIHSAKDMPTELPEELMLSAVPERADVRDVLISKYRKKLNNIPENGTIVTGSFRRRVQILRIRQDLKFEEMRGNIDTRIKKFYSSDFDGMILAKAGVERMGYDNDVSEIISEDVILPSAGQGALGIELRKDDCKTYEIVRRCNHRESELSVVTERAFLRRLGGGCRVPIGVLSRVNKDKMIVKGFISDIEGNGYVKDEITGLAEESEILGIRLAEKILSKGGKKIISSFL